MSDSGQNFDGSPQGLPPWKTPASGDEVTEMFYLFLLGFPDTYRLTWLLNLLDVSIPVIANRQKISFEEVTERLRKMEEEMQNSLGELLVQSLNAPQRDVPSALAEKVIELLDQDERETFRCYDRCHDVAEVAQALSLTSEEVQKRLDSVFGFFRDRIRFLTYGFFQITSVSPEPFNELFPQIREAKELELKASCEFGEKRRYDVIVVQDAPKPILAELIDAKNALFEMAPPIRDAFALTEGAGMTLTETASLLGTSARDIDHRIEKAMDFLVDRMDKAVVDYLKRERGDETATPPDPIKSVVAQRAYLSLPDDYRAIYKQDRILGGTPPEAVWNDAERESERDMLEEARKILGQRLVMALIVQLRLMLNGMGTLEETLGVLLQPELVPAESVDRMGVFEYALNLLETGPREAIILRLSRELELPEIAVLQGVSITETAVRIDVARKALLARVDNLLQQLLMKNREGFNLADLTRGEERFARKLYRSLPEPCQEAYAHFLLQDHSIAKIAEDLGDSTETVQEHIEQAKALIERKTLRAIRWSLARISHDRTVATRILDRMRRLIGLFRRFETESFDIPPTDHELREAAAALKELEPEERSVATLFFGENKDEFETAQALGFRVAEVVQKLKQIRESFRRRMTSLVYGYLRDAEKPGSIRMDESARETGRIVFDLLHPKSADLLKRSLLSGDTAQEIADKIGLKPRRMENRLESVEKLLGLLMERLVQRSLRPAERVPDAVRWFFELDPVAQDVYIRHALDGEDPFDIAASLGAPILDIDLHIDAVQTHFENRTFEAFRTSQDATDERPEYFHPVDWEILRRVRRAGESPEQVAESLELTPEELEYRLENSEILLAGESLNMACRWLKQRRKARPQPAISEAPEKKIRLEISKPMSELTHDDVSEEELQDAAEDFLLMNVELQEVFLHRRVFGKSVAETAKEMDRPEDEIERLYEAARNELKRRLIEQLDLPQELIQKIELVGGDAGMNESLQSLLRIIGQLGQGDAESVGPDAYLDEIESLLIKEFESLLMLWFTKKEDGVTNAERMLTRIRLERSRQDAPDVWDKLFEKDSVDTDASVTVSRRLDAARNESMDSPKAINPPFPASATVVHVPEVQEPDTTIDFRPNTVMPTVETVDKIVQVKPTRDKIEWFTRSLGVMSGFFGFSKAASASTATKSSFVSFINTTIVSVLATISAPFIWVALQVATLLFSAAFFVEYPPTLNARRWLVKQLFCFYSIALIFPIMFVWGVGSLRIENNETIQYLITSFVSIWLFCLACCFARMVYEIYYWIDDSKTITFKSLQRLIKWGFIAETLFFVLFISAFASDMLLPRIQNGAAVHLSLIILAFMTTCIGSIHGVTYLFFQTFLKASKDEEDFLSYHPPVVSLRTDHNTMARQELYHVALFASMPITAKIIHLAFVRERSGCVLAELIVYTAWWFVVWQWNIKYPDKKWIRLGVSLFAQIIIMVIVKSFFY